MRVRPLLLLASALLVACTGKGGGGGDNGGNEDVDSDGDGLFDAEEAELGTDPASTDSDMDYMLDGDEVAAGTDPTVADTDGDTYLDGDEALEGTDPLSADSRIYTGYWPYNRDKDSMTDPGFEGRCREDQQFPRITYVDQFGEEVDLYDFAGQDKLIVVDVSAEWCYYCQELAKMLEGRRSYFDGYFPNVKGLVDNGDIYWVTILAEDSQYRSGGDQTAAAAERWAEQYEHPLVPVMGDEDYELTSWEGIGGYPWLAMIDSNATIVDFDPRSNNVSPLYTLEEMVANGELPSYAE